jgi:transcriptional regulator with XRE-family HTH domain
MAHFDRRQYDVGANIQKSTRKRNVQPKRLKDRWYPSPREELSAFLRERRRRIRPESVGLPVRQRNKYGLARQEIAELLGVTSVWYALFESGAARRKFSAAFLRRVGDVLQFTIADRDAMLKLVVYTGLGTREVEAEWSAHRCGLLMRDIADASRRIAQAATAFGAVDQALSALLSAFAPMRPACTLLVPRDRSLVAVRYAGPPTPCEVLGTMQTFDSLSHESVGETTLLEWTKPRVWPGLPKDGLDESRRLPITVSIPSTRSLMLVPIRDRSALVGLIRVETPYERVFCHADAMAADTVAVQLARALGQSKFDLAPD